MQRKYTPGRLDVRAFAEDAATLAGELPLAQLPRLASEAREGAGERPVAWSARGEMLNPRHVQPEVWVHVQAQAAIPMTCQRCLEAVEVPLQVDRPFRFVADEETASAEDDEAEEDVLAISRAFNLLELVEDELLMEVPLVPRHEVCPADVQLSAQDADFEEAAPPENPFARLQALKDKPH